MNKSTLRNYISGTRDSEKERLKAHKFLRFAENLFGEETGIDYANKTFPEFEKHLSKKKSTLAVRGNAGELLRNLIIKFKGERLDPHRNKNLLERAKKQLRRYIYIIWKEHDTDLKCLLMASDGIRNYVYKPILKGDLKSVIDKEEDHMKKELDKSLEKVIELEKIDEMDISKVDSDQVYDWLDRYLIHKGNTE